MSKKDVDGFVMAAKERYGLEKRIVKLELFMKYLLQSEVSIKKYNEWLESKGYEIRRWYFWPISGDGTSWIPLIYLKNE